MPQFAIEHLTHERLLDAWPIVRASAAHPSSDWWLSDAARLIDHGGGVLAARGADGMVYGIATYRLSGKPHVGRMLAVESLTTFELSSKEPARRALCDALDTLSLAFECKGIGIGTV